MHHQVSNVSIRDATKQSVTTSRDLIRPEEDRGVATGSKTGQICIWDLHRKNNDKDSPPNVCRRGILTVRVNGFFSYAQGCYYSVLTEPLYLWHLYRTGPGTEMGLSACVIKGIISCIVLTMSRSL